MRALTSLALMTAAAVMLELRRRPAGRHHEYGVPAVSLRRAGRNLERRNDAPRRRRCRPPAVERPRCVD